MNLAVLQKLLHIHACSIAHITHTIQSISHGGSFESMSRYYKEQGEEEKHFTLDQFFWSPRDLKVGSALLRSKVVRLVFAVNSDTLAPRAELIVDLSAS